MCLEHAHHGNDSRRVFSLQEEIQVVEHCTEVRAKTHDLVGDFGEIVLTAVVDEAGLSQPLYVSELEPLQAVSAGEQFPFENVGVVFLADGANVDVKGPVVLFENPNDLLLSFVGGDVKRVLRLFGG